MNNRERQKLKYYLYRLKKAYRWFDIEMQVWVKECEQSEKNANVAQCQNFINIITAMVVLII